MIILKNITKDYVNKGSVTHALNGIDLSIEDGELLAIVGTSGSGKTTLLNIIGGMDQETSGEYYYNNELVSNYSKKELQNFRRDYISFVFQKFELMDDYNVSENVEMPLLARKIDKNIRKDKISMALKKVGLENLAKKMPNELSGGQKQRCAIARALVTDNPILLADEPTGALDSETGVIVLSLLQKQSREKNNTVILVTHNADIAKCADKVIRMKNGKIREIINNDHPLAVEEVEW